MTRLPSAGSIRRPVLAPGLRSFTPGPGEIQIGLTSLHRLRLPDSPALRRVLTVLNRGEAPRDAASTRRVLADLAPVLRDGDILVQPGVGPADVAVAALRHPLDAGARLRQRSRQRVQVVGDLGLDPEIDLHGLIRRCGLGIAKKGEAPTAVVVLVRGEPDRADLDQYLRNGTPHLLVRAIESEIVIGPFVAPELTACLRCLDAHLTGRDVAGNRHPHLLSEYLSSSRLDGVPEPLDSAAATIALGWAVTDLVRFAEGDRPTTWSATITLGGGDRTLESVPWFRHPGCGCSWSASGDAAQSVTMAE